MLLGIMGSLTEPSRTTFMITNWPDILSHMVLQQFTSGMIWRTTKCFCSISSIIVYVSYPCKIGDDTSLPFMCTISDGSSHTESSLPSTKMSSSKLSIMCFDSFYDDRKHFPRQDCVIYWFVRDRPCKNSEFRPNFYEILDQIKKAF